MVDFKELLDEDFGAQSLRQGAVVSGKIVKIDDTGVYVDIGAKTEGNLPLDQLLPSDLPRLQVGDEIKVKVLKQVEGEYILSKRAVDYEEAWNRLAECQKENEAVTITIDSEPPGALCWLNDNEIGRTPVTVPFTWYGTYRVRLEKPGYEPLEAEAPVWIDGEPTLISELLSNLLDNALAHTAAGGNVVLRVLDGGVLEVEDDGPGIPAAERDRVFARFYRRDTGGHGAGLGLAIVGEVRDTEIEDWRKVLSVNLDGVVHGSLLAYKQMVRQGHGHIVNVASVEGLLPFPATVSYVTTKFGVVGLSQGLWVEGKDLGVDVSVVCPGWIKTNIVTGARFINMDRERVLEAVKMWIRFGVSPQECARVMLRGVARKKRIITVTGLARIMWWIARISPTLMMNLARKDFAKWRNEARIEP